MAYAVITHCRSSREKSSDLPIEGKATFTIDTSRIVMKKAAHTTVSAFQRSGSACIEKSSPVVLVHRTETNGPTPNRHYELVAEVAAAGEGHRRPCLRDGGDHLLVAA